MHTTSEHISGSRVKLIINIDEDMVSKAKVTATAQLSRHMRIPGFRPGKAMLETVRNHVGEEAWKDEVVQHVMTSTYPLALKEQNVRIVAKPEEVKLRSFDPFSYEVIVPVYPQINLGKYKKISVQQSAPTVTDGEVEGEVTGMLATMTTYTSVSRAAQTNDQLLIDFIAHEGNTEEGQGRMVEGTEGKEVECVIGSGRFIRGFEEELVGLSANETKKFPVTFPADYRAGTLAGKTVTFTVTVREVRQPSVPELSEDFIERVSGKRETTETFRGNIRSRLLREKTEHERDVAEEKVVEQLLKTCSGEIPQTLVTEERSTMIEEWKSDLQRQGTSMERFLQKEKKNYDQFVEELGVKARERVTIRCILREITDQEKIQVTDGDIETEIERIVSGYHADFQDKARTLYQSGQPAREHLASRLEVSRIFDLFIKIH